MAEDKITANDLLDAQGIGKALDSLIAGVEAFDQGLRKVQKDMESWHKEAMPFEELAKSVGKAKVSFEGLAQEVSSKKLGDSAAVEKLVKSLTTVVGLIEQIESSDGIRLNTRQIRSDMNSVLVGLSGIRKEMDAMRNTKIIDVPAITNYLKSLKAIKLALSDIQVIIDATNTFTKAGKGVPYATAIQNLVKSLSSLSSNVIKDFSIMEDTTSGLQRSITGVIALLGQAQQKSGRLSATNSDELTRLRRNAQQSLGSAFEVLLRDAKAIGVSVEGINLDISKEQRLQLEQVEKQVNVRKAVKKEVVETAAAEKRVSEAVTEVAKKTSEIANNAKKTAQAGYSEFGALVPKKRKSSGPAAAATAPAADADAERLRLLAEFERIQQEEQAKVQQEAKARQEVVAEIKQEVTAEAQVIEQVEKAAAAEEQVVKKKRKRIEAAKEASTAQIEEVKAAEKTVAAESEVLEALKAEQSAINAVLAAVKEAAAESKKRVADATAKKEVEALSAEEVAAKQLKDAYFGLEVAQQEDAQRAAAIRQEAARLIATKSQETTIIRTQTNSYDQLTAKIKLYAGQYKALSAEERGSQNGIEMLNNLNAALIARSKLTYEMTEQVKIAKALQKAESDLAVARSGEAVHLATLKEERQIAIDIARLEARRSALSKGTPITSTDISGERPTGGTQIVALNLQDEYNKRVALNAEIEKTAERRKYEITLANSAAGSYEALSAEFNLNRLRLQEMGSAERVNSVETEKLITRQEELQRILRSMQNSYAGYTDVMHKFGSSWNGLTFSISQVIREIPAAAVSMNTFFLAISNNIPMVLDEVQRLRAENKRLAAEGKQTTSVLKAVGKSIFSLNSLLVIAVTLLTFFGEDLIKAMKNLKGTNNELLSHTKMLKVLRKELKETSKSAGTLMADYFKLKAEWENLKSTAEQTQWLKDNKTEFDKLGVAVNSVNDADNVFVANTGAVIEALYARTMAEAAAAKAGEKFAEAIEARVKADELQAKLDEARSKESLRQDLYFKTSASAATTAGVGYIYNAHNDKIEILEDAIVGAEKDAAAAMATGKRFIEYQSKYTQEATDALKGAGIGLAHKSDKSGGRGSESDLGKYINDMALRVNKTYNDIIEDSMLNDLDKTERKIRDKFSETQQQLLNIADENARRLAKKHKALTKEQLDTLADADNTIQNALEANFKRFSIKMQQLELDRQIARLKIAANSAQAELDGERENSQEYFELRLRLLNNGMEQEIAANKKLTEDEQVAEYLIRRKWLREMEQLQEEYRSRMLNIRAAANDRTIASTSSTSSANVEARVGNVNVEYTQAINANRAAPANAQVDEATITAVYRKKIMDIYAEYFTERLAQRQDADKAEFLEVRRSQQSQTMFELQQEKERWELKLALMQQGMLQLSKDEVREAKANVRRLTREIKEVALDAFKSGDLSSGLLSLLGFDDAGISAFEQAKQQILSGLQEILDAEVQLAEKQLELQQEKVDAAQSAYDAEVAARANGYANSVQSAKRELQLQQNTLRKKQAQLEKYRRAQQAIEAAQQAASLVTATANIWSSMSSLGVVGPILAAVATAGMFAAFIAAKVKASQLTETYGSGGLEFLEGGSHASGNDIDLHTTNSRGRHMRAEGGEAMAIINKRRTRKYRSVLPDIVNSLNAGTFEERYIRAHDMAAATLINTPSANLSTLEKGVDTLVKQNSMRAIQLSDRIIITEGNTTRTIKL